MRALGRRLLFSSLLPLLSACTPSRKDLGDTLRFALRANFKTFDPALCSDVYSHTCQSQIYETLYQYKYLARPYDVEPLLAAAPPEISDSGRAYLIRMRRGVRFTDDPCFPHGQGREVTAHDFIYSIKRMADQRTLTTGWWIFEGKIRGLDEFRAETENLPPLDPESPRLDSATAALYDRPVEGLRALDDSTVSILLHRPYPYFKYILAMPYAAVVAREAVWYYGVEFMSHPVGTGPFILAEWQRGLRLVMERNPAYRHGLYPTEGSREDSLKGLLADAGKSLPFVSRLEISIFEEDQPMWLNFLRGNLDRSAIPKDNFAQAVTPAGAIRPELAARGLSLFAKDELDLTYVLFNMEDPVVGKHVKLRKAMALASDNETLLRVFYNNQAVRSHSPIPPGLFGHDTAYTNPNSRFDLEGARRLLAEAGFPGGKGLPELSYLTQANTTARQMTEHFIQDMAKIGVRLRMEAVTWPEFLERLKKKQVQLAGAAWGADYPDPENFLQLLYGPNVSPGENNANYRNAEYDRLYLKMAAMQDSPERLALIQRMKDILAEDCPWILNTHRARKVAGYEWVLNNKPHAIHEEPAKYLRIDREKRAARLAR